jgi:hypothetical protein
MSLSRTQSEAEAREIAAADSLSHGYCIFDGYYYVGPAQALRELGCSHIDFPAGWPWLGPDFPCPFCGTEMGDDKQHCGAKECAAQAEEEWWEAFYRPSRWVGSTEGVK